MSIAELADDLGVHSSMVSKIETGNRPITHPDTVRDFSEALGIDEDTIYRMQNIPPPDILEMLGDCVGLNTARVRWALQKILNGEMFDEEIAKAKIDPSELPGDVLLPRKRTAAEEKKWEKMREEAQVTG